MVKENTILNYIKKNNNLRITEIEKELGKGDSNKGIIKMKNMLNKLANENYTQATISKMINKDRHVIHNWYKRYNIEPLNYQGFKPSLIKISTSKDNHDIEYGSYQKINGKIYRLFQVYPTPTFSYLIGLILGDGSIDQRKIYITGGKPFDFLDKIYPISLEVCKYLGNRTVKIKYYDEYDNKTTRNDSKTKVWRLYIYWSALAHALKEKKFLKTILRELWAKPELFNAFIAGLFDADGYFVYKNKKPERIGISQTFEKWWFLLLQKKLEKAYLTKTTTRKRKYEIKKQEKTYRGLSKINTVIIRMSSWSKFIDNIILTYCNKPRHLERAPIFIEHVLKVNNRLRFIS